MSERAEQRAQEVRNTLAAWGLVGGQDVEVEVLVAGQYAAHVAPRLIEGTITGATGNVLVLNAVPGDRTVRVPWHAIATVRDRVTAPTHPAL